jgi:hypothetical protein
MAKFIFTGDRASIDTLALRRGDEFEADPEWVRSQGFPAVLAVPPAATAAEPIQEHE